MPLSWGGGRWRVDPQFLVFGGVDREQLKCNMSVVLSGGLDTTATQLLWIMQTMAQNPHYQEQLFQQIQTHIGGREIDDVTNEGVRKVTLGTFLASSNNLGWIRNHG